VLWKKLINISESERCQNDEIRKTAVPETIRFVTRKSGAEINVTLFEMLISSVHEHIRGHGIYYVRVN
jgi:hypothetical protein